MLDAHICRGLPARCSRRSDCTHKLESRPPSHWSTQAHVQVLGFQMSGPSASARELWYSRLSESDAATVTIRDSESPTVISKLGSAHSAYEDRSHIICMFLHILHISVYMFLYNETCNLRPSGMSRIELACCIVSSR
jgi:hypothetical protein